MAFYIERLSVSGPGKQESVVEFQSGVNIICGPSNTGKTYIIKCIDYMFGATDDPIVLETGYNRVTLTLCAPEGCVTMSRLFGQPRVEVTSTHPDIVPGRYLVKGTQKNYEDSIASVWLKLIGIKNMHLINSNGNRKKQLLTWRTFCHTFLLTEQRMISLDSALLPDSVFTRTAALSAIVFLLIGRDFAEAETLESKEIREAKKTAIKKYINEELFSISERKQEVNALLSALNGVDIQREIDQIASRIEDTESRIRTAVEKSRSILADLHQENETLTECLVLLDRYEALRTQYASDLERLSFIVDGEVNITKENIAHCPFCDGTVVVQRKQGYIDAAKTEYSKIVAQSKDLEDAYAALLLEKTTIEQRISDLLASKNSIEAVINETLKPELASLKDSLAQYKYVVELESEIAFIQRFVDNKAADILKVDTTDDGDGELFDPKEYFDYDMVTKFCEILHQILEECKYPNLTSVTFERNTMDIAVNGKRKKSNGKGYAAYLNTTVVIGFAKYLKEYAEYAPGLVVADSPILSLKEKDNQRASESMRAGLFEYIANKTKGIQVIVAENEIPNIEYKDARIIRFTKEPNNGRYGFLADVVE